MFSGFYIIIVRDISKGVSPGVSLHTDEVSYLSPISSCFPANKICAVRVCVCPHVERACGLLIVFALMRKAGVGQGRGSYTPS